MLESKPLVPSNPPSAVGNVSPTPKELTRVGKSKLTPEATPVAIVVKVGSRVSINGSPKMPEPKRLSKRGPRMPVRDERRLVSERRLVTIGRTVLVSVPVIPLRCVSGWNK